MQMELLFVIYIHVLKIGGLKNIFQKDAQQTEAIKNSCNTGRNARVYRIQELQTAAKNIV